MTFNLLHDPWVPTRPTAGTAATPVETSLLDVFQHGATLDLAEYELFLPALTRQALVPIVMDAAGTPTNPDEWLDLWEQRHTLYPKIKEYLLEHEEWFTVGTGRPYGAWLVQNIERPAEPFGIEKILAGAPSGNNVPIATWGITGDYALTIPEALRATLIELCWGTSGRKNSVPGARGTHPGSVGVCGRALHVMPTGKSLLDTIFLNVPLIPDGLSDDDLPPWKRDLSIAGEVREPHGIMELLTWQPRRISLYTNPAGQVTHCTVAPGDGSTGASHTDPHVAWTTNAKGEPTTRKPSTQQPTWLGLPALLTPGGASETGGAPPQLETLAMGLAEEDPTYPLRLHVSGAIYGEQRATYAHITADTIPTTISLLRANSTTRPILDHAITTTHHARDILGRFAYKVGGIRGATNVPNFANQARTHLDATLTPHLHHLLLNLDNPQEVAAWTERVTTAAEDILTELSEPIPTQTSLRRGLPQAEITAMRQLRALEQMPEGPAH